MQLMASLRTALSAQPPPTHPSSSLPKGSIIALEPCRAEEEPSTRTHRSDGEGFAL